MESILISNRLSLLYEVQAVWVMVNFCVHHETARTRPFSDVRRWSFLELIHQPSPGWILMYVLKHLMQITMIGNVFVVTGI